MGFGIIDFRLDKNFLLSEGQCPANSIYHQTFEGFQNMSFLGVPLFISKNHFYSCPDNWTKLVQMSTKTNPDTAIMPSSIDDSILSI